MTLPVKQPYLFKPFQFEEVYVEPEASGSGALTCCNIPEPRSGHRTVCDDGNLYSFGGYLKTEAAGREHHRLFEELWCFNFAEQRWKYLPTSGAVPQELASHCAFLYGNYLHVFGGTTTTTSAITFGELRSNKLSRCDLRTLEWQVVETTGDPPEPQYGQALLLDEDRRHLYVIGGTNGFDFTMDVHRLDLRTFGWELLHACKGDQPSEPAPRYRHEIAFDGENIFVFGGGTSTAAFSLKVVPTFNIMTKSWKMLKTKKSRINLTGPESSLDFPGFGFPSRRKCHSSAQVGDDLYIFGGCNGTHVYRDVWKFHIPTRQWLYIPINIPVPLSFHASSLVNNGCIYMFGGVTNIERGLRTNRIFKIWLKIPKLKEICWVALLQTNDEIKRKTRDDLMNLGIPMDFVRRVHPSPPSGEPNDSVAQLWESELLKTGGGSCPAPNKSNCVSSFV